MMAMGTITITGTLKDAYGNPLSNKTINLNIIISDAQGNIIEIINATVNTDANGNYSYTRTRTMYLNWSVDVYAEFTGDSSYKSSSNTASGICTKATCC